VPLAQRQLCLQCPARRWCLATAIETGSQGYWAGTTAAQRRALCRDGQISLEHAEGQQPVPAEPTHLPGQGSMRSYRRDRCRCPECKRCNADAKFIERSKQPPRGTAAATVPVAA